MGIRQILIFLQALAEQSRHWSFAVETKLESINKLK